MAKDQYYFKMIFLKLHGQRRAFQQVFECEVIE